MINKKNELGKVPFELGTKDAVHVAIVSVRAGRAIKPGSPCTMDDKGEAIPSATGVGIADPFRKTGIARGEAFWLILNQDAVPNVRHVWEHEKFTFEAPSGELVKNRDIDRAATILHVTYDELMAACDQLVSKDVGLPYPRPIEASKLEDLIEAIDSYDLWYEWSSETGYDFPNCGSDCCPEYDYPSVSSLFTVPN